MAQTKICPFCQSENDPQAELCEGCEERLPANKPQFLTTEKVAKGQDEPIGFKPSVEHLGELSADTLVLFVADEEAPIVLEDVQDVILGRPMAEMPAVQTLDLTNYGAMMFGVSRRHAQISYASGTFTVVDLGSTNGTLLNGRSLPPARSQRLRPYDQLVLGQLRLMVYFQVEPTRRGKSFFLTHREGERPLTLTPHYLANRIMPYLQALAQIQKISKEVRGQSFSDVQVRSIQAGKRPAQVRLTLLMADEAIDIVRQWIGPWQRIYADQTAVAEDQEEGQLSQRVRDLVATIADSMLITYSEPEALALQKKLAAPVSHLATSGLELTLEV